MQWMWMQWMWMQWSSRSLFRVVSGLSIRTFEWRAVLSFRPVCIDSRDKSRAVLSKEIGVRSTRRRSSAQCQTGYVAVVRFSRAELESFRGATVPDLLGSAEDTPTRLLFVGINPGLWTAAAGAHFARRGNRFWPALHQAGITPHLVDASGGMTARDRQMVLDLGVGISNLVPVATSRADELTAEQLRAGGLALARLVDHLRPVVVAVLGITAYRQAFGTPASSAGRQSHQLSGAELWVLPNPSGLNAHETIATLAAAYRDAALAAKIIT
jgi:double-stranded uracil-DNA glycosylase